VDMIYACRGYNTHTTGIQLGYTKTTSIEVPIYFSRCGLTTCKHDCASCELSDAEALPGLRAPVSSLVGAGVSPV
jgi:hypothetical protein